MSTGKAKYHPSVDERIERFNYLFALNCNGRLGEKELGEFLELQRMLRRIGIDVSKMVKVD